MGKKLDMPVGTGWLDLAADFTAADLANIAFSVHKRLDEFAHDPRETQVVGSAVGTRKHTGRARKA